MKKKKILFACIENSFRSQIAEGIALKYFNESIEAYSAGSAPSGRIHPGAIMILREMDIDISKQYSKGFDKFDNIQFDYLVTMGCDEICPFHASKKHISWNLPDIKNESIEKIRELRDIIKRKIKEDIIDDK